MASIITEHVYNDRDNTVDLLLKADGVPQDLTSVTRMLVEDKDGAWQVDSAISPAAFDWFGDATGKVVLTFGHESIDAGGYTCRLTVYDPGNPNGVVWGDIVLRFYDT